jgi:glycerophosphoryl diester phosphodiesterase
MKTIISMMFLLALSAGLHAQTATIPKMKHKFIVIAHRGDHTDVPENTLAAFENGIKNGVDYVEIDLRTSKDSVLVIMHDATVDRMTSGKGKVSELFYSEIQALHVFNKLKDTAKSYPIPTFEEVLKICKNKIYIYLDFKDASVLQAYNLIKKYGMENQVIVYINTAFQYREWRRLVPSMLVMLSLPDKIKTGETLNTFLANTPLELLDGDYKAYDSTLLQVADRNGKTVWPDIQGPDESKNWDSALQIGFKGLQTDHPEALIDYLKKKGLR